MNRLKRSCLLLLPFILVGCNGGSINKTKSPFNDKYSPVGMSGQYNITGSISTEDYNLLRKSIKDYSDNNDSYVVKSYRRVKEERDLKAAYFGKNLGAANLCALVSQDTTNTRYSNYVTTSFSTSHNENQTVSGGINKTNSVVKDFTFSNDPDPKKEEENYQQNEQINTEGEEERIISEKIKGTFDATESSSITDTFGLKPYDNDIKTNFGTIKKRDKEVIFNVLDDNNNAIYGMSGNKYLIKEATSLFAPYSTAVGDTYKAVNNFFYEALLEKVGEGDKATFRFTDFRFYTELLILSEAMSDETKVPVLYLEKPQLVEYTEIKYSIQYANKDFVDVFDRNNIPGTK